MNLSKKMGILLQVLLEAGTGPRYVTLLFLLPHLLPATAKAARGNQARLALLTAHPTPASRTRLLTSGCSHLVLLLTSFPAPALATYTPRSTLKSESTLEKVNGITSPPA